MNSIPVTSQSPTDHSTINWRLMGSLTALYASIVVGWIAYEQYQPQLLVQFNLTEFTLLLAIVQATILTITPPLAGRLGDKYRRTRGHRFPVISLGISFAAMVFMAVAFALISNPGEVFRWVLPFLIILWLIAMSIFTSPALSTIETFIPVEKLPRAMAILTITANLLYSMEPIIVDIIDYLGAPTTFVAGGVFVFVTGVALRRNAFALLRETSGIEPNSKTTSSNIARSSYGYIFVMGAVLGIVTALLFHVFPDVLEKSLADLLNETSSKMLVVGILIISGLLALPFSSLVTYHGLQKSFLISLLICIISLVGIFLMTNPLVILLFLVLFSIGFSSLSVSSLPLAMERSGFEEKVFCVGIFFSGVAIPDGIFEVLQSI